VPELHAGGGADRLHPGGDDELHDDRGPGDLAAAANSDGGHISPSFLPLPAAGAAQNDLLWGPRVVLSRELLPPRDLKENGGDDISPSPAGDRCGDKSFIRLLQETDKGPSAGGLKE
jgi:hypothetical protein